MKWLFSLLLLFVVTFATIDTFESDVANETELVMSDFDIGDIQTNLNFQNLVFDPDVGFEKTDSKSNTLKNSMQIQAPFRKSRDGFLCS